MAKQTKLPAGYENNPFNIAIGGITLLFDLAKGIGFLLIVISLLSIFRGGFSSDDSRDGEQIVNDFVNTIAGWTFNDWLFAVSASGIILLAIMLISALFGGVSAYTSLRISRGHTVRVGEAFRIAFERLWSFLWLQIIIFVKVFLWTLLLIVPGIIMATRYSLANVAFFDDKKELRGNAAIKESLRLTKGAWITTYGSNMLFNIITFGAISSVVTTAVNAVLYRQFDKLSDKKPDAHWLSWLALVLPFVLFVVLFLLIVLMTVIIGLAGVSTF